MTLQVTISDRNGGGGARNVQMNSDEQYYADLYNASPFEDKPPSASALKSHIPTPRAPAAAAAPDSAAAVSALPFPSAAEFDVCVTKVISPHLFYAQVMEKLLLCNNIFDFCC